MLSASRRCLEGLFDTYGAFGRGFTDNLERGGPKPYGARKANLSMDALPYAQEIALQEQVCPASQQTSHALYHNRCRHLGFCGLALVGCNGQDWSTK